MTESSFSSSLSDSMKRVMEEREAILARHGHTAESAGRAGLTIIDGNVVALNPTPDNIKDRLIWAFSNYGAIGANRSVRGFEELQELSAELGVDRSELQAIRDRMIAESLPPAE